MFPLVLLCPWSGQPGFWPRTVSSVFKRREHSLSRSNSSSPHNSSQPTLFLACTISAPGSTLFALLLSDNSQSGHAPAWL